jgi:hypothetical protein
MVNVQRRWRARPSLKPTAGLSAEAAKAAKADGGGGRDRTCAGAGLDAAALPLSYTPVWQVPRLSLCPVSLDSGTLGQLTWLFPYWSRSYLVPGDGVEAPRGP